MTSFLVRKASIFVRSFCSFSVSFSCWAWSSLICVSSVCSSVARGLALERHSGQVLAALRERLTRLGVELDHVLLELRVLHLQPLAVTTSAMPFLTFWSISTCF